MKRSEPRVHARARRCWLERQSVVSSMRRRRIKLHEIWEVSKDKRPKSGARIIQSQRRREEEPKRAENRNRTERNEISTGLSFHRHSRRGKNERSACVCILVRLRSQYSSVFYRRIHSFTSFHSASGGGMGFSQAHLAGVDSVCAAVCSICNQIVSHMLIKTIRR